jgi:hypothetical protein
MSTCGAEVSALLAPRMQVSLRIVSVIVLIVLIFLSEYLETEL